jgi:hypothetical protein
MVMKLEKVVPFGRSLAEYKSMFALSEDDLDKAIVGVGDGPASFNAEMFGMGKSVVSVDPLYVFRSDEIEKQFYSVVDDIIAQVKASPDDWVWSYHESPEHLKEALNKPSPVGRGLGEGLLDQSVAQVAFPNLET